MCRNQGCSFISAITRLKKLSKISIIRIIAEMPSSIQSPSFSSRRASQYFLKHTLLDAVTQYIQSCTLTILGMNNKSDSFALPQKRLNNKKTPPSHVWILQAKGFQAIQWGGWPHLAQLSLTTFCHPLRTHPPCSRTVTQDLKHNTKVLAPHYLSQHLKMDCWEKSW